MKLMSRDIRVEIVDPNGNKVATLYDSGIQYPGQITDIKVEYNKDEFTKLSFTMPVEIPDEDGELIDNPMWQFIRNEYMVRYIDGGKSDLFTLKVPVENDTGLSVDQTVTCIQIAEQLKRRGLVANWDATTGNVLTHMNKILAGTGWTAGTVDAFYEEDLHEKTMELENALEDTPGDMAFGAYGDISEATGHTTYDATLGFTNASYTVRSYGKNLCDNMFEQGGIDGETGTPAYNTVRTKYRSINYLYVRPFIGQSLTISNDDETIVSALWHWYDAAKTYIGTTEQGLTTGVPSDAHYMKVEVYHNSTATLPFELPPVKIQLELGTVATAYVPYVVPYTVSFQLGEYDSIARNTIIRKTVYNSDGTVTEAEVGTVEEFNPNNVKLYENGTIALQVSGLAGVSPTVKMTYPVDADAEDSGQREKWRSVGKEVGTTAYETLVGLQDTFGGRLRFNGETKTVDFVHAIGVDTGLSFKPRYNMKNIKRTNTSTDNVTRLYVINQTSENGYLGIESVNPLGTDFLLDFSYYDELNILTDEQREAISEYEGTIKGLSEAYQTASDLTYSKQNELVQLIGVSSVGSSTAAKVSGSDNTIQIDDTVPFNGGTDPDEGDILYLRTSDGTWTKYGVNTFTKGNRVVTVDGEVEDGITHAWWFTTPPAGIIGGRLIILDTKMQMLDSYTGEYERATDEDEKARLLTLIQDTEAEIEKVNNGYNGEDETVTGLNSYYMQLWTLVDDYNLAKAMMDSVTDDREEAKTTFEDALANLIHDGIFPTGEYADGQQKELYSDAMEYLHENSHPLVEYSVNAIERSDLGEEFDAERIHYGDIVYVDDPRLNISNLQAEIIKYTDQPLKADPNTFDIGNFAKEPTELFADIVSSAEAYTQSKEKYDRIAAILDPDGKINARVLAESISDPEVAKEIDLSGNPTIQQAVLNQLNTANLNGGAINWTAIGMLIESIGSALNLKSNESITQIVSDINTMEFGGRNLLRGTGSEVHANPLTEATVEHITLYPLTDYFINNRPIEGTPLTLSFDWATTATSGEFYPTWDNGSITGIADHTVTISPTNQSGHYEYSWEASGDDISSLITSLDVTLENMTAGSDTVFGNAKLEFSTKPSTWSPAPEDTTIDLDALNQSLSAKIQEVADGLNNKVDSADYDDTQRSYATFVNQTNDSFDVIVSRLNTGDDAVANLNRRVESMSDVNTYLHFDENGLTIGKVDDPFAIQLSNDRMSFLKDGAEIAYISAEDEKLYINDSQFLTKIRIGNYEFEVVDGILGLYYLTA